MGKQKPEFDIAGIFNNTRDLSNPFLSGRSDNYPEQFFSIPIHLEADEPDPDTNQIHNIEWGRVVYDLNMRRKNEKIKYLKNELKLYIEKEGNSKLDFLNHIKSMFSAYPKAMANKTEEVVRNWVHTNLTMAGQLISQETTPNFSPAKFANSNWKELVKLIEQNNGVIMAAVKSFCSHNKSDKEIRNITRTISRMCKDRGVKHKKNYSIDIT